MTEMIEEEKYPKSDSYGISDLKNSKMTGSLSCDLGIDLREETTDIYIVIKCHDRETCTEKGGKTDENNLAPLPDKPGTGFVFKSDDKVGFSNIIDLKVRFFFFDFGDQIHDRHYITSWFIRVKIYNRHHPEPIQDFTVAAGKFCNVLKINVWMVYLDILI